MKPTPQAILHDPAGGVYGDCFRAAIASLLELPIEQVPHFCHDGHKTDWYTRLIEWLRPRGLTFMEHDVSADGGTSWRSAFDLCGIRLYHTITGPSPRFKGELHCVIGLNGEIAFDPHPDGGGLAGPHTLYGFLIHTGGA